MSTNLASDIIKAVQDAVVRHGPDPFMKELIVTALVVAADELSPIFPQIRLDIVEGLGVKLVG